MPATLAHGVKAIAVRNQVAQGLDADRSLFHAQSKHGRRRKGSGVRPAGFGVKIGAMTQIEEFVGSLHLIAAQRPVAT